MNDAVVVAEEVRHILAELGYKSINDIIGRPELVRARTDVSLKKLQNIDVSYITDSLNVVSQSANDRNWLNHGDSLATMFEVMVCHFY